MSFLSQKFVTNAMKTVPAVDLPGGSAKESGNNISSLMGGNYPLPVLAPSEDQGYCGQACMYQMNRQTTQTSWIPRWMNTQQSRFLFFFPQQKDLSSQRVRVGLYHQTVWVQSRVGPLSSYVTLTKLINVSVPRFSHLEWKEQYSVCHVAVVRIKEGNIWGPQNGA